VRNVAGLTVHIANAHRSDGRRFIVRSEKNSPPFLSLKESYRRLPSSAAARRGTDHPLLPGPARWQESCPTQAAGWVGTARNLCRSIAAMCVPPDQRRILEAWKRTARVEIHIFVRGGDSFRQLNILKPGTRTGENVTTLLPKIHLWPNSNLDQREYNCPNLR
jgi:hypothetical protein